MTSTQLKQRAGMVYELEHRDHRLPEFADCPYTEKSKLSVTGGTAIISSYSVQELCPSPPRDWNSRVLSSLLIAFPRDGPQIFEEDIPGLQTRQEAFRKILISKGQKKHLPVFQSECSKARGG